MFGKLRASINRKPDTVQIPVSSDKLIPKIVQGNKSRFLTLQYEDTTYPCLSKAWMSWADKVLKPSDLEVDPETGRKKRWSTATIRKFLDQTDPEIANPVIQHWWKNHEPTTWNVVKYADNGEVGPIRYVGTERYRLYKHSQFLDDLQSSPFSGMRIQGEDLNENRMVLRITDPEPLDVPGTRDLFAGFHIMNSENGSSSILIKFLIYDLLCTNGLMHIFERNTVMMQKHSRFKVEEFRQRVVEAAATLPEIHDGAKESIKHMVDMPLDGRTTEAIMKHYKKEYEASQVFVDEVVDAQPQTGWALVSEITSNAQRYGWDGRLAHETNVGKLMADVRMGRHTKYLGEAAHV